MLAGSHSRGTEWPAGTRGDSLSSWRAVGPGCGGCLLRPRLHSSCRQFRPTESEGEHAQGEFEDIPKQLFKRVFAFAEQVDSFLWRQQSFQKSSIGRITSVVVRNETETAQRPYYIRLLGDFDAKGCLLSAFRVKVRGVRFGLVGPREPKSP